MPWYALDVGIGHRHHDEERRRPGVGREELPSLDDPLVAVASGPGLEAGGVGPALGLGHRVRREDLAVEQRAQVALLLLVGAVVGDDLGVARVRRLAPEDDGSPPAAAQDLVHERQLHLAVSLAPELGTEMARPQLLRRAPAASGGRRSCGACRRGDERCWSPHNRSSGSTSSRTKASIQSSLAWNSGSVENSQPNDLPQLSPVPYWAWGAVPPTRRGTAAGRTPPSGSGMVAPPGSTTPVVSATAALAEVTCDGPVLGLEAPGRGRRSRSPGRPRRHRPAPCAGSR